MNAVHHWSAEDFSRKVRSALLRKGIAIIGKRAIPDGSGSYLGGEVAYEVNDNDTHRMRTYAEVCALAGFTVRGAPVA